jgi:excinuclease ABC subunit C
MSEQKKNLELYAKAAPKAPGVYLFKDALGVVVYVGKARNIYNRLGQYFAAYSSELKATSIINSATTIEWIETETELAALLLEARMIQSHQPSCNVLLKTGQPYYYFFISAEPLARFDLVRTKSKKGNYFGPFIDKGAAKRAFRFLQKEFQLFLCGRTIEGGCLAYHLGKCAGSCKSDFDKQAYSARIALLKRSLKERPNVVAAFFDDLIAQSNAAASFEYSAQLVGYKHAMLRVHQSLALGFDKPSSIQRLADRDVWVWLDDGDDAGVLALFADRGGVLKKERVFFIFRNDQSVDEVLYD